MESVIHQALGHVFHFDAGALPLAEINDALVRNEAVLAFEEDREIAVEPFRHVVCIQDGHLGGLH